MTTLESLAKGMRRQARWGRTEAYLVGPLDAWIEVMGQSYMPYSSPGIKKLKSAMRELVAEVGETKVREFLEYARRRMHEAALTVRDPRSLLWLVPEWRRLHETVTDVDDSLERGRFLKGRLAEE